MSLENPFSKKPILPPEETNPDSNIELIGALLGSDSAEAYRKTIAGEVARPQQKPEFNLDAFDEKAFDKHHSEISTTYTRPDGTQETITLNLEQKLKEFLSFYQKTTLNLSPDFEDTIRDLWGRYQTAIEQAIEQNGFDDILFIPGNIPLAELAEKMKMESGYFFLQFKKDYSAVEEDFSNVTSQNVDRPRIVLYHQTETLEEIAQKTGLDVHLKIAGTSARKLYQAHPENYLSTLEDSLILERKYLEDTGKHLSDYIKNSAQWLPGSTAGARLVNSSWAAVIHKQRVFVNALEDRNDYLGVRPSRCFF